jgi:Tfp pilus assembly protein PilO
MKLKILFPPFALALAIILIIWFLWPNYGDLRTQMSDFQSKQTALQNIKNKEVDMQNLKNSLDQNTDKESFVQSYLPSQKDEEKIINSINFLANSYQLNLQNVSIEKVQETSTTPTNVQTLMNNTAGNVSGVASNIKDVQYISATIGATGTYDQLTKFIGSINKMEFLNKIDSVEISAETTGTETPGQTQATQTAPSSNLNCIMKVDFGYLTPISVGSDFSAPIFSQTKFDFSKVDQVIQSISEKAPALDQGSQGEGNPFFP